MLHLHTGLLAGLRKEIADDADASIPVLTGAAKVAARGRTRLFGVSAIFG